MNKKFGPAWLMLGIAIASLTFTSGLRSLTGILIPLIERDLSHDRAALSAVASLALLVYAFSQPVVGWAIARWGARRVLLLGLALAVASGVGMMRAESLTALHVFLGILPILSFSGAGLIPGTVLAAQWFARRQGTATGIFVAALPGGQGLFAALAAVLLVWFSWRTTYVALALIPAALILPLAFFFLRDAPKAPAATASAGMRTIAATRDFWLLAFGYFVCGVTDQIMLIHLVAHLTDIGESAAEGSAIFALLSFAGVVGAIAVGPFVDRWQARHVLAGVYALRLLSYPFLFLFGATLSWPYILTFAVLFGLTFMGNMPATSVFLAKLYGARGLSTATGWLSMTHHVGGALGVLAAGVLHHTQGSYTWVFISSAVLLALSVGTSLALSNPRRAASMA